MQYSIDKHFGSVEQLNKRFVSAQALWQLWRSLHQEACDYALPQRETFYFNSQGQRKGRQIYDSTTITSLQSYVNKIQAGYFPDWTQWIELKAGETIPKEEREAIDKQLEEATDTFFSYHNQSNFSTEITPALMDRAVGTGCLEVFEGRFGTSESVINFTNVPLAELYLERVSYGNIKSSWRQYDLEVSLIKQTWPDAELPNDIKTMLKGDPNKKITILNGHLYNYDNDEYNQFIMYKKHLLFEQKFKTMRRIVFRDSVTPGETYGRGPIIRLIPDTRSANVVKQFILQNGALQVAGVYTARNDGVFNPYTAKIKPGAVIPVNTNDTRNPAIAPLPRSGDIGLGGIELADLREHIHEELLSKPMGDITDPVRSATEMMLRHQDDVKKQSTSSGRLKSELVVPMVNAEIDILKERGLFPDITVDGREVKLKMVSPLAKQSDIDDFQSSQLWWQQVKELPEAVALGSAKMEELPSYWAEKLNVSMDLVRDEEQRPQITDIINQIMGAQSGQ